MNQLIESSYLDKLLIKTKENDQEAFHELYEILKAPIYSYSLTLLKNKDDALDNIQDVFIKIYENISSYEPMKKPLNWIFTITKNLAFTKLRKRKDTVDIDQTLITTKNSKEDQIFLKFLLLQLSQEEQTIILLHLLWGFKFQEIAKIIDSNLSTVLSKYHRAIKKIKEMEEI